MCLYFISLSNWQSAIVNHVVVCRRLRHSQQMLEHKRLQTAQPIPYRFFFRKKKQKKCLQEFYNLIIFHIRHLLTSMTNFTNFVRLFCVVVTRAPTLSLSSSPSLFDIWFSVCWNILFGKLYGQNFNLQRVWWLPHWLIFYELRQMPLFFGYGSARKPHHFYFDWHSIFSNQIREKKKYIERLFINEMTQAHKECWSKKKKENK